MIDRDEINAKAAEFDIHHANVERDYLFGWLLKSIFENEYLRRALVFKGGNCLRKAFYPETRFLRLGLLGSERHRPAMHGA